MSEPNPNEPLNKYFEDNPQYRCCGCRAQSITYILACIVGLLDVVVFFLLVWRAKWYFATLWALHFFLGCVSIIAADHLKLPILYLTSFATNCVYAILCLVIVLICTIALASNNWMNRFYVLFAREQDNTLHPTLQTEDFWAALRLWAGCFLGGFVLTLCVIAMWQFSLWRAYKHTKAERDLERRTGFLPIRRS
ncbi:hypothetical protein Ddc_16960 [Ditylenchus destructor]|nr:hypothetical protein Ddc_16960 [Ditylenchus destructor]